MELRQANLLVTTIVQESNMMSPAKRYLERSGAAFEKVVTENALLRKENAEFRQLSQVRKERKKGKRIAIKGKFVFNSKELLDLIAKAEAEALERKTKKGRKKQATTPEIEEEEEDTSEDELLGS